MIASWYHNNQFIGSMAISITGSIRWFSEELRILERFAGVRVRSEKIERRSGALNYEYTQVSLLKAKVYYAD